MRVAVVGASGNVGTALLRHLAADAPDWEVVAISRRPPEPGHPSYDRARWVTCDVSAATARATLSAAFAGMDAVVHLAWLIQPSHDEAKLEQTNLAGSRHVFDATVDAHVPHLVYVSSVGAYSPGPKDHPVDESWPTEGVPASSYSRHKAAVERLLDQFDQASDAPIVTRVRPALIFQHDAGSEIARYFLGRLVPTRVVGARRAPVLPVPREAVFQAVHADDVARGLRLIIERRVGGAFNLAADPVMTPDELARLFRARRMPVPARMVRLGAAAAWRGRLQPTEPGWVDLALAAPIMSTRRAREELDWVPRCDARDAISEMLDGMRDGAGTRSPALAPR
jgi:UDP-glucose 4-epimerase